MSPAPRGSTLITSAPKSASIVEQNGPASAWLRSSTRTSSSGIFISGMASFQSLELALCIDGASADQREHGINPGDVFDRHAQIILVEDGQVRETSYGERA